MFTQTQAYHLQVSPTTKPKLFGLNEVNGKYTVPTMAHGGGLPDPRSGKRVTRPEKILKT
jgi:hypothetical protein